MTQVRRQHRRQWGGRGAWPPQEILAPNEDPRLEFFHVLLWIRTKTLPPIQNILGVQRVSNCYVLSKELLVLDQLANRQLNTG